MVCAPQMGHEAEAEYSNRSRHAVQQRWVIEDPFVEARKPSIRQRATSGCGMARRSRMDLPDRTWSPSFLPRAPASKGREAAMTHGRPPRGGDEHARAVDRLDTARDEQSRLQDRADAARGTPAEDAADDDVRASRERVAAGEAWLTWVERGF